MKFHKRKLLLTSYFMEKPIDIFSYGSEKMPLGQREWQRQEAENGEAIIEKSG